MGSSLSALLSIRTCRRDFKIDRFTSRDAGKQERACILVESDGMALLSYYSYA